MLTRLVRMKKDKILEVLNTAVVVRANNEIGENEHITHA